MNTNAVGIVGWLLILVGFTDNIWSWLTPLSVQAAFFDGLLVLAGAFLAFNGNFKFQMSPITVVGWLLIIVGFTDNMFSWLTPLTSSGAAFDSIIILVGGFFAFVHASKTNAARGH